MPLTRIIQVTDPHVAPAGERADGVDTRSNFLNVITHLESRDLDYLVVSGDLSYRDGDVAVYRWMKQHLDALKKEYIIIPGNHDLLAPLATTFRLPFAAAEQEMYFYRQLNANPVLFLDTSRGNMSDKQMIWLKEQLATEEEHVVIFMHHPPVFGRIPHMDNHYALQNMNEVQELFRHFNGRISVFSGHYHVEKTISIKNTTVYITPSSFFNMKHEVPAFEIEHHRIGYREIVWDGDLLYTYVHYL